MRNKSLFCFINKNKLIIGFFVFMVFMFMSCKHDSISFFDMFPNQINSFKSFFIAWLAILAGFILLTIITDSLGIKLDFIILIILFIIVLIIRDYGFFMTLLLFFSDGIVIFFLRLLFFLFKNIK